MAESSPEELHDVLCQAQAIRSGHFVLTSGRHSDTYVQCARVFEDPTLTLRLAREAVEHLPSNINVDLVASPAVGGLLFGFAVAQALGVNFIFTERENGKMTLRRGFEIPSAARVLIVEDVVTTGGSVAEVVDVVRGAGAEPVGVVSMIDRGGDRVFDLPFWPLLRLQVESWDPHNCHLCAEGKPVSSPGSRRLST